MLSLIGLFFLFFSAVSSGIWLLVHFGRGVSWPISFFLTWAFDFIPSRAFGICERAQSYEVINEPPKCPFPDPRLEPTTYRIGGLEGVDRNRWQRRLQATGSGAKARSYIAFVSTCALYLEHLQELTRVVSSQAHNEPSLRRFLLCIFKRSPKTWVQMVNVLVCGAVLKFRWFTVVYWRFKKLGGAMISSLHEAGVGGVGVDDWVYRDRGTDGEAVRGSILVYPGMGKGVPHLILSLLRPQSQMFHPSSPWKDIYRFRGFDRCPTKRGAFFSEETNMYWPDDRRLPGLIASEPMILVKWVQAKGIAGWRFDARRRARNASFAKRI
ncbi:hypothetical protein BDN70DRAFT_895985 [Pholiota conissans]|uniref:Uncharacterized protein n=1 Tax=Pholiota conissans TaxID=109636 RepID=A0A9P6CZ64_9AGAR|nr:hypothetical protein BDN70DRAFT_895985 [Pholiota conissans]